MSKVLILVAVLAAGCSGGPTEPEGPSPVDDGVTAAKYGVWIEFPADMEADLRAAGYRIDVDYHRPGPHIIIDPVPDCGYCQPKGDVENY
jgi:hypothetical protein